MPKRRSALKKSNAIGSDGLSNYQRKQQGTTTQKTPSSPKPITNTPRKQPEQKRKQQPSHLENFTQTSYQTPINTFQGGKGESPTFTTTTYIAENKNPYITISSNAPEPRITTCKIWSHKKGLIFGIQLSKGSYPSEIISTTRFKDFYETEGVQDSRHTQNELYAIEQTIQKRRWHMQKYFEGEIFPSKTIATSTMVTRIKYFPDPKAIQIKPLSNQKSIYALLARRNEDQTPIFSIKTPGPDTDIYSSKNFQDLYQAPWANARTVIELDAIKETAKKEMGPIKRHLGLELKLD
jgi:hypothetical protein